MYRLAHLFGRIRLEGYFAEVLAAMEGNPQTPST
jgi:hypothetical protein